MATGKGGGRKARGPAAPSPRRGISRSIITLLTDFGVQDHFVAAMKGVILSVDPSITIVDITHAIPPQDIHGAAFNILAAHDSFPDGTIHVAVVDPGVGSNRSPIVVEAGGHIFVGPDNGIFSFVCESYEPTVRAVTNERLFRHPVSSTFHGRDVFAPVAAAIARGVRLNSLGPQIDDWVKLPSLVPNSVGADELFGRIIHIDHFGNCVTNFTVVDVADPDGSDLKIKDRSVRSFRRFFAEERDDGEAVFAYWGSAGFLEVAVRNGSAAKALNAHVGDGVSVRIRK